MNDHTQAATLERESRRLSGGPGAIGYVLVAVLVGVSLVVYFLEAHTTPGGPIADRGTGFVIGEATGIAAAVLLPVAVILASRAKPLAYLFGDLTSVYVAHGVIGLAMFAIVSFHPMMYLLGGLLIPDSFLSSAHVLVPFHVVALDWASYILIAIALVVTMYMKLSFSNWRWVHLLLGMAMILTGYSILIENGGFDTAAIPGLQYYLFAIYGLATIAFVWVALVRRVADPRREYRIVDVVHHEAANAIELSAEPVGAAIDFEPGQFTYVDLLDSDAQIRRDFESHPFSFASAPGKRRLSLVIETRGSHTVRLKQLATGDDARALLHGTYGRLVASIPARRKQLWVGGGIGITPFMSMAEDMGTNPGRYEHYEVTLVICVHHPDQAFGLGQFREWAKRCGNLEVHLWSSDREGRPTAAGLGELVDGDLRERAVLLSGPEGMIADLTDQLLARGVPRGQIRAERMIGPPGNWRKASPSLRAARAATTAFFAIFVLSVVVSVVGRAIFA